jgi:hypothetical protein
MPQEAVDVTDTGICAIPITPRKSVLTDPVAVTVTLLLAESAVAPTAALVTFRLSTTPLNQALDDCCNAVALSALQVFAALSAVASAADCIAALTAFARL